MSDELSTYQAEEKETNTKSTVKRLHDEVNVGGKNPDKDIFDEFTLKLTAAEDYRSNYYDELWDEIDDAVLGIAEQIDLNDKEKEYRSNIRMREAYIQAVSMTAKLIPSFLGQNPPIQVTPFMFSDISAKKAYAVQQWQHYEFMHRMNPVSVLTNWGMSGSMYGLGVFKQVWDFDFGWMTQRRPIMNEEGQPAGFAKVRSKGVRKDEPKLVFVNTRNFWWNPDADDTESIRWTIERYTRPMEHLMRLQEAGVYRNVDKIKKMNKKDTKLSGQPATDTNLDYSEEIRTGIDKDTPTGEEMVEIHELWTPDYMAVIANKQVVLNYRDNPYDDRIVPYYYYRGTVMPGHFVGMGEVEPILDLEEGQNTIRNMRLDNLHRVIHPQLLVGATSGLKGRNMRFTPLGMHHMTDINQIKQLQIQDVTQSSYLEEQKYEQQIDKTNGNFDVGRGEGGQGRQTATEVATRVNSANLRTDLKVQFGQIELGRSARDRYRLWKQFGNPNKVIQVIGQDGRYIQFSAGEVFAEEYEFAFSVGGYLGNRLIDQQQFTQLLQVSAQIPGLLEQFEPRELSRLVAFMFPTITTPERILRRPPNLPEGYSRDPIAENRMFLLGEDVVVLEGEQDADHITAHIVLLDAPGIGSGIRSKVQAHINQHRAFLAKDNQVLGSIGGQTAQQNRFLQGADETAAAQNLASGPGGATLGASNQFAPNQLA